MHLVRFATLAVALAVSLAAADPSGVIAERVPDSGLQPRVAVGSDGTVHLAYLRGDPKAADAVVRHRAAGASDWSAPVVVNSQSGSALAIGTVRGVQLAVGRGGRLHFVWNGSSKAEPKPRESSPLLFASLAPVAAAASAQRCVSEGTRFLDGGAAVAADANGHVLAVWHAAPMDREGEDNRRVFIARSDDDGARFGPGVAVPESADGVCGCCGLQSAFAGDALLVLYRRADHREERGMTLLVSRDLGATWKRQPLDTWAANQCPMSTATIVPSDRGAWLGWENAGRVRFAPWSVGNGLGTVVDIAGGGRKHPTLALAADGGAVFAWTTGTGWERGGTVGWARLGAEKDESKLPGVPVWGSVAAYRAADGVHVLY